MLTNANSIFFIFECLLVSLVIMVGFSWVGIRLARRTSLIDRPGSALHKTHKRPIPIAGGVALLLTVLFCSWLLGVFDRPELRACLVAALPVFFFGLWDDFKSISPPLKLLGQVIAAVLLISLGIYIQVFETIAEVFFFTSGPIYLYLDWFITVLWIVGMTNAFNFVDSMDGLAVGIGGMAASFFMLVTLDSGQFWLAYYSAILIGACLGLYFFNALPAMLFLGDSGAQLLGFLMAVLAILYDPLDADQASSWFVPILLLSLPIFDASLVVVSRLRRGRPVYTAALDHTYHRLLRLGIHPNRAVLAMHIVSLALGCLAFICLVQPPLIANLIFFSLLALGVLTLLFFDRRSYWV
ncbi:MAG: undecaprenyl/decaprenyl-phosphate alpha-N-acetylglucosaminyl 1-phosphate transferase [Anaerolineales bacterium]|nr:undecaprenyl/decaprenyl-phosphate alpha-N-acetylglucosaminyl 1-phosphate transferase [Anaerolineales bacterium]